MNILFQNIKGLLLVVGIVFLLYIPALQNGFVNWDDDIHLVNNPYVQSLSWEGIKDIFSTTTNRIYIPLTNLTFAVEHFFVGAKPFLYHMVNVLFHCGNLILKLFDAAHSSGVCADDSIARAAQPFNVDGSFSHRFASFLAFADAA